MTEEGVVQQYNKPEEIVMMENENKIPMTVESYMISLIPTAGTIQLTAEQRTILYAPVEENKVEIRPDGLVYLPWMEYVLRLRDAFGLEWAIIPHGNPRRDGNHIMWPFYMVIQGKLVAYAIGEQEYRPDNRTMTWGDACEGAKSNALMRLCKNMGISLELWQPSFIRAWKLKHTETYQKKNRSGVLTIYWKRKDSDVTEEMEPSQGTVEYITEAQISTITDFINAKNVDTAKFLKYMNAETVELIPATDFNKAVTSLKAAKGKTVA